MWDEHGRIIFAKNKNMACGSESSVGVVCYVGRDCSIPDTIRQIGSGFKIDWDQLVYCTDLGIRS
jgi:hypothetical protein